MVGHGNLLNFILPHCPLVPLTQSLGGLFRSERWMTFARWVRTKPFVRRITWAFKAGEILNFFKSNPLKSSNIFHHSKKISAHAKTCCWFLDTLRILVGTTPIVAAGFKICFPKFKIMQIGNIPILPLSITYMAFKERLKLWFQFLNSVFITAISGQHCLVEDNSVTIDKVMIITGWPYRNLGK